MSPDNPTTLPLPGDADRSVHGAQVPPPGTLLAGRYRLGPSIGLGGAGEVFESDDELTGQAVAIKLLNRASARRTPRVRREIAALRLLRLPGVVRLLDEGIWDSRPFLVMELAKGSPFPGDLPGGVRTWHELRDVAVALLEVIAQVHAAGVIHRDLKPSNVLVNDAGQPTILDFGLSGGPSLGPKITEDGTIVGTLEYLAPEQCRGEAPTVRTDLYALGVMLFQALTGRLPHDSEGPTGLLQDKLNRPAPRVRRLAPTMPYAVASAIDRMLDTEAQARPRSAEDVLTILAGADDQAAARRELPWLGDGKPADEIAESLLQGRCVHLRGGPGSGRSRLIREVTRRLIERGITTVATVPAREPFDSLAPVLGELQDIDASSLDAARHHVQERLAQVLEGGCALVADDSDRLDRWSAEAIAALRTAGAGRVLTASAEPVSEAEDRTLSPLAEADLRALFAGPERLLHIPSDAAAELFVRTRGRPASVVAEVAAWRRAGHAIRDGARIEVSRDALNVLGSATRPWMAYPDEQTQDPPELDPWLDDLLAHVELAWPHATEELLARITERPRWRLQADLHDLERLGGVRRSIDGRLRPGRSARSLLEWTESRRRQAHDALADALPPAAERRLYHLISAGRHLEVVQESRAVAATLRSAGQLGQAAAVLGEGLVAAREEGVDELPLLTDWVDIALASEAPEFIERILFELGRVQGGGDGLAHLEGLCRAALAAHRGSHAHAEAILADVPPFEDVELERRRLAVLIAVTRSDDGAAEAAVVDAVGSWARTSGLPEMAAVVDGWTGLLRYRQGRFAESAELHSRAAEGKLDLSGKLSSMLNCASACMEALDLQRARLLATEALEAARACRLFRYEARAEWLLRSIDYRAEVRGAPDVELAEAVARLGVPKLEGMVCVTEAAMAWRAGELDAARELAASACRAWRVEGALSALALSEALLFACTRTPSLREVLRVASDAMGLADAALGVQALGLLTDAVDGPDSQWIAWARDAASRIPESRRGACGEVMSVNEALERLGAAGHPGRTQCPPQQRQRAPHPADGRHDRRADRLGHDRDLGSHRRHQARTGQGALGHRVREGLSGEVLPGRDPALPVRGRDAPILQQRRPIRHQLQVRKARRARGGGDLLGAAPLRKGQSVRDRPAAL